MAVLLTILLKSSSLVFSKHAFGTVFKVDDDNIVLFAVVTKIMLILWNKKIQEILILWTSL